VTSQKEHRAAIEPRAAGGRTLAIEVDVQDRIAVVTFNRPERRNAFTLGMWREVPRICAALEADAGVRGIVFTGADGHFSAGADILEFEAVRKTAGDAHAYEEAVDACCDAMAVISKPTIAAISGFCMGGGCHVAVSCDFRFTDPEAAFGIPAAKLSIVYGIRATQKLLALVGMANAKRILFAGDRIAAAEAKPWPRRPDRFSASRGGDGVCARARGECAALDRRQQDAHQRARHGPRCPRPCRRAARHGSGRRQRRLCRRAPGVCRKAPAEL
jgi:dienelactone hydrolase